MAPIDCPSSFLTIVGLLALYKADIADREFKNLDDFVEWLRRHDHDSIADAVLDHPMIAKSLEYLVSRSSEELTSRLGALDKIAASVAAHVDGFETLSTAVRIDSQISEQSVSILRQLNDLSASAFIEYPLFGRAAPRYVTFGGMGGDLKVRDVRFIEDDIHTLVQLGLLNEEQFNGHRGFRITRTGAALGADHLDGANEPENGAAASLSGTEPPLKRSPR